MNFDDARQVIEGRLNDNWSTTRIVFGESVLPPTDGNWVRISILPARSQQIAIGVPVKYRHWGIVVVEVYTTESNGANLAMQYGDTIATLYRGVSTGGVIFRTPTVRSIGREAGWHHANVEIPFQWDSTDFS